MKLTDRTYVPDEIGVEGALARTTHLAIAAHHDDLEILAVDGILRCLDDPEQWFCGVVATDGGGAPRTGPFAECSDGEMRRIRRIEQQEAAARGGYGSVVFLDHSSAAVKHPGESSIVEDLVGILHATRPRSIYTHNLADKHDTHVAVALRTIEAVRRLEKALRPTELFGCEVWRDLDWLVDEDKVIFDVSPHEELQEELLRVFESQVEGGKKYDQAVLGRRRAHATFHASHEVDAATLVAYVMNLTPLVENESLKIDVLVNRYLERFAKDVSDRIHRLSLGHHSK